MIQFSLQKKLQTATGAVRLSVAAAFTGKPCIGIYGPSGAGKTSILRMLAGFLPPDEGYININDAVWYNSHNKIMLPTQKRSIGVVFQDYALFPNMTVKENLLYALDKKAGKTIADEMLALTGMEQLQHRKTGTLSGGQKQRVALARALVRRPQLLLLDEPLSALDAELREKLQSLIYTLHKQLGLITVLVSHDMSELMRLTDQIIFLNNGVVEKRGSPLEMFSTTNSKSLCLEAVVIDIHENGSISAMIGKQIVQLTLSSADIASLQKGDTVTIRFDNYKAAITGK